MSHRHLLPIAAALFLVQCGANFDPGYRVTSLRVLAVKADEPIAHPGDTVNMKALWYTPPTDTRPQQWVWATCENPVESSVYGCVATMVETAATSGQAPAFNYKINDWTSPSSGFDSFSFSVPADTVSSLPTQSQPDALVGVLLVVCPGTLTFVPPTNTAGEYNPFQCTDANTGKVLSTADYVAGFKRVFVRTVDTKSNPTITNLEWDGSPWDSATVPTVVGGCAAGQNNWSKCDSSKEHTIQIDPIIGATGTDQYGQTIVEEVVIEYYATDGLFSHSTRLGQGPTDTDWNSRAVTTPTTQTLWVVAHDSRGGTDWQTRTVSQTQ